MFFSNPGGVQWLLVFLGNPGPRYAFTRHNAGFLTCDALCDQLGVKVERLRFHALTGQAEIGGEKVLLMKPQTMMNLSGDAVAPAAKFYKVPPERVIVVSDEVSLPVGQLRIRKKGSAGGHNGLKSIISRLGSDQFPRIRVGVGSPPHPDYDMADWVLGTFQNQDAETIRDTVKAAAEACVSYIQDGPDKAMSKFNQKK